MEAQIVKWGNGQGIRIPKGIMQELGLGLNEKLNLVTKDGKIIIERPWRHRTLEERAQERGGKLGPYQEFDWGDPVGREVW